MIAYCGLNCLECKALIATQSGDDALRAEVAQEWSEQFHVAIPAKAIYCTGCTSDGVKFHYCESMCEIRKCAMGKGYKNCGECSSMPCEQLKPIFEHNPQARINLQVR
ncbi:MAG: DUF3795 domain-containing protein [Deltaproteobacteria bacterium]|nr:DUF3795 domain-containing protein [Deltaproteobacteria bacterium]